MPGPGRVRPIVVVVTSLALTTACSLPRFGAPKPAEKGGSDVQHLWSGFFVGAALVTVLVWGLLVWVVVRYRRRPGDDELPSQKAYNIPIEVLYTAIPVLVVIVLFFVSVSTQQRVTRVSAKPAVRVTVIGFQWGWQFAYDGLGFTVNGVPGHPPELVLPLGETAQLRLVSNDVNHAFWVPRFLTKRDLIPGVRNEIDVTPTAIGSYIGRCAEFCGLDHWAMYFSVRVVSPADYQTWLAGKRPHT